MLQLDEVTAVEWWEPARVEAKMDARLAVRVADALGGQGGTHDGVGLAEES